MDYRMLGNDINSIQRQRIQRNLPVERELLYRQLPDVDRYNGSVSYLYNPYSPNSVAKVTTDSWSETVQVEEQQTEENAEEMSYGGKNLTRWRTYQPVPPGHRPGRNVQGVGGINVQQERVGRENRYASNAKSSRKVTYETHRASDIVEVEYQKENNFREASNYNRTQQGRSGTLLNGYNRAGWPGNREHDRHGGAYNGHHHRHDIDDRYRPQGRPGYGGSVGYSRGPVGYQSGHAGVRDREAAHRQTVTQDLINDHTRNTKYAPSEDLYDGPHPLDNRDPYSTGIRRVKIDSLGRTEGDDHGFGYETRSYKVSAPYAVDEDKSSKALVVSRPLCRPGDTQPIRRMETNEGILPGKHVSITDGMYLNRCPVCREYLRDPRELQCQHRLCRRCLEMINKRPDTVVCPTCRRPTTLSNGSHIDNLPAPDGYFKDLKKKVVVEINAVVSDLIVVEDIIAVGTNTKLAPIHMFDFEGRSLAQIGRDVLPTSPKLTHNSRRNLIIANNKMKIATFDSSGSLVNQMSNPTFQYAGGIVYNRTNDWYLIPDERTSSLLCYSPQTGRVVRTISLRRNGGILFQFPVCVACDNTGLVAVSDRKNHQIDVIDLRTEMSQTFGYQGKQYGELNHPLGLCFDDTGRLLICDSGNRRVVRLTMNPLNTVTGEQWECMLPPGSFGQAQPKAVSVSPNGVLVVSAFQKAISIPDTVHVFYGYC